MKFQKTDYDYYLPHERIAQHPVTPRSHSGLLVVHRARAVKSNPSLTQWHDAKFIDLSTFLRSGDLLVFNDTKVLPVRLRGRKRTGGTAEIFMEQLTGECMGLARCKLSHPRAGVEIVLEHEQQVATISLVEKMHDRWCVSSDEPLATLIEKYGEMPIPPYLGRGVMARDRNDYQTVYARHSGAVAAPTAGLHFDAPLLQKLEQAGVQLAFIALHTGAGTFLPIRHHDVREHTMHGEYYKISEETVACIRKTQARGGSVIAVGTTTLRALESAAQGINGLQAGEGESHLYVLPGFQFKVVDRLITNFHQPGSTLLVLVSAFAGYDTIRQTYDYALQHDYRFLSYGDGMLLTRQA